MSFFLFFVFFPLNVTIDCQSNATYHNQSTAFEILLSWKTPILKQLLYAYALFVFRNIIPRMTRNLNYARWLNLYLNSLTCSGTFWKTQMLSGLNVIRAKRVATYEEKLRLHVNGREAKHHRKIREKRQRYYSCHLESRWPWCETNMHLWHCWWFWWSNCVNRI